MQTQTVLDRPEVQLRLQIARYAQAYGIRPAARHFAISRNRVRRALQRDEAFRTQGDTQVLLNQPRGASHRTPTEIEQRMIIYFR